MKILNRNLFLKRTQDIITSNTNYVEKLEDFLSDYLSVKHVIALSSKEKALEICLSFLSLITGGEYVITPSFAPNIIAKMIIKNRYKPSFCDIKEDYCIDPESYKSRLTDLAAGSVLFFPFGNYSLLNVENDNKFSIRYSIHSFNIFEESTNKYVANFGDCEIFAFDHNLIFGAFCGSVITTNNDWLAKFAREQIIEPMSEMQAMAALCQLENIEEIQTHYYEIFKEYQNNLPDWIKMSVPNNYFSNYSFIPCRIHPAIRDQLIEFLEKNNIFVEKLFSPVHKQYQEYSHMVLPNTERISQQNFCLPINLSIGKTEVIKICNVIKEFVEDGRTTY